MLNYIQSGEGNKKIVFIHGNSSSSRYWNSALKSQFLNQFSLFAIDLPGHGNSFRSNFPLEDYTMQGMAIHVLDFIEKVVKDEFILVGHSLGCNIIGELANKLNNCKGIILTSPSIIGKNLSPGEITLPNPSIAPLFSENSTEEGLLELLENVSVNFEESSKLDFLKDYNHTDSSARTSIFHSIVNGMYCDELTEVENLNIPIAVVFGNNETLCNIHYLDALNLKLYTDKPILIDEAGHYLQFDQGNQMNKLTTDFMEYCFQS